jgi:hypothetical protein
MFATLAIAPSAFGSHIFFSPVTANGVTLSENSSLPTLLNGANVTFETEVEGPEDLITFSFSDSSLNFQIVGTGLVSFSRILPTGAPLSVFVDLSSSFPDYIDVNNNQVDGQYFYFQAQAASAVPEPGTVVLLGGGLAALGAFSRARRRTQN